jgi:hypothetical protein
VIILITKIKIKNLFNLINEFKSINKIFLINSPENEASIFNYDITKNGRCTNFMLYGLGIISEHLKKNILIFII